MNIRPIRGLAALAIAGSIAFSLPAAALGSGDSANRLLGNAARLIISADHAQYESKVVDYLRRAKVSLLRVIREYPDSDEAFALETGQAVGAVSLTAINERLRALDPCAGQSDPPVWPTFDCVFSKTKEAATEHGMLRLHADVVIAGALAGNLEEARRNFRLLGQRRNKNGTLQWAYFNAGGVLACRLADAGFTDESRDLFFELMGNVPLAFAPENALEYIAMGLACAGRADEALKTARRLLRDATEDESERELRFVDVVAGIAEELLRRNNVRAALDVLTEHDGPLLEIDRRESGTSADWRQTRTHIVHLYGRIGQALARSGAQPVAAGTFDRALAVAMGGNPVGLWSDIGAEAVENRNSSFSNIRPSKQAERAVRELTGLALAIHATGIPTLVEETSRLLEDAEMAAGGEPRALGRIAAARAKVEGMEVGRAALAFTMTILEEREKNEYWQVCMGGRAPYCSFDHGYFERAEMCSQLADADELPTCWSSEARHGILLAHYMLGDTEIVESVLSCVPDAKTVEPWTRSESSPSIFPTIDTPGVFTSKNFAQVAMGDGWVEEWPYQSDALAKVRLNLSEYGAQIVGWGADSDMSLGANPNAHMDLPRFRFIHDLLQMRLGIGDAVDFAAGIVDADLRAEALIKIAQQQIESGMIDDAYYTLVLASAATDELLKGDREDRWKGAGHLGDVAVLMARALWV